VGNSRSSQQSTDFGKHSSTSVGLIFHGEQEYLDLRSDSTSHAHHKFDLPKDKKFSNRPKIPRIPLSKLVSLSLRHALDEMVVVTPQLLLVFLSEVEVHEGEDCQRICKHSNRS
jgi:hypothetical protein